MSPAQTFPERIVFQKFSQYSFECMPELKILVLAPINSSRVYHETRSISSLTPRIIPWISISSFHLLIVIAEISSSKLATRC